MNFDIFYRLNETDGLSSTETKQRALDKGCALIDQGAEITDVKVEGKDTLRTHLTVGEIYFESAQRHKRSGLQ